MEGEMVVTRTAQSVLSRDDQLEEFLGKAGWGTADRAVLAADASFRRYDRLSLDGRRAVLMDAPPPKEDVRPFLRIARHLLVLGYSAPAILAEDPEAGFLLLEDLGDATFTRLLAAGEVEWPLYQMALDLLIDLHKQLLPDSIAAPYDRQTLLTEVSLLTEWYAPAVGIDLDHGARAAYLAAWQDVLKLAFGVPDGLVLRDFHVDNLMRIDGRSGLAACGLLDFQDALVGPVTYDLVSLFEDARRDIDPATRAEGRRRYLAAFPLDQAAFDASWACLAVQRHAKVIGIFTRLCKRDGKPTYLRHIPRVWGLLEAGLQHPGLAPVKSWFDRHIPGDKRTVPPP